MPARLRDLMAAIPASVTDGVLEALVLFAAAYLAEPYLARILEMYSPGISASAYWVPLILISLQYGLLGGFLSAAIATFLLVGGDPDVALGMEETVVAYTVRVWLEPVCFFALAVLLGGIRSHDSETRARLRRQLAHETETVDEVARRYVHLRDRVEQLERALATGTTPTLRNAGVRPDELADLPARACVAALYRVLRAAANGAAIRLVARRGKARIELANPDETGQGDATGTPAAAIFPISDGEGETLIEVHLRSVDPGAFGPDDREYFRDLCDRIGRILARRGVTDLAGVQEKAAD